MYAVCICAVYLISFPEVIMYFYLISESWGPGLYQCKSEKCHMTDGLMTNKWENRINVNFTNIYMYIDNPVCKKNLLKKTIISASHFLNNMLVPSYSTSVQLFRRLRNKGPAINQHKTTNYQMRSDNKAKSYKLPNLSTLVLVKLS